VNNENQSRGLIVPGLCWPKCWKQPA